MDADVSEAEYRGAVRDDCDGGAEGGVVVHALWAMAVAVSSLSPVIIFTLMPAC